MRRDLNRGCAACRLRYSSLLTHCPVCRAPALTVADATSQVQPTSRAAWLAKWAIVLTSIPALGLVAWAGLSLSFKEWPPKNAFDIVMYVMGGMGAGLGASLAVGIPLAVWFGFVATVRALLKFIVDRPRRALRITIERGTRPSALHGSHPMHRAWNKLESFARKQIDSPKLLIAIFAGSFIGAQALAEVFGARPTVKLSSLEKFGESMVVLAVINGMSALILPLFLGVFGWFLAKAHDFFTTPPNLFGYDPTPPVVQNDECLESFMQDRQEIVGHVAMLDEAEQAALGAQTIQALRAPLSGQTCLAFRIVGEADGQPADDADAIHFAVITSDQKRCVVANTDVVVSLIAEKEIRADGAHGFLQERGLPEKKISAREAVLREGDFVRVVGRRSEIRVGAAGYRGDDRRMMIDAGDDKPVVVLSAGEGRS